MNQYNPFRLSYLIFAFIISCFIVYSINKGFRNIDIITIPVFAIILYLIIDLSANMVFQKNVENFIAERFDIKINKPTEPDFVTPGEEEEEGKESFDNMENQPEVQIRETPLLKKFAAYADDQDIPNEEQRPMPMPAEEEEERPRPRPQPTPQPAEEEEQKPRPTPQPAEEEEQKPRPTPPTPSGGGGGGKAPSKQQQAKKAAKKAPDMNRHRMDTGLPGLSNKNLDTVNPININVSYNNNKNMNENPDYDMQLKAGKKDTDLGKFCFDSGLEKKNTVFGETTDQDTLLSPVNPVTVNSALANLNQEYYPAYLENPLNKNQPGTHIKSVFDKNRQENAKMARDLKHQKERNQNADRKILVRNGLKEAERDKIKPHWTQSNYETTRLKDILNEKNSPAPVLLNSVWSEWKPVNYQ